MTTKQAAELYTRVGRAAPPEIAAPLASKYGAQKKTLDGHTFDSTGEADCYVYLKHLESIGVIHELQLQPRYLLQELTHAVTSERIKASTKKGWRKARNIFYVPDFRFVDSRGGIHVMDFKGFQTAAYKIKSGMFRENYPDIIFEEMSRAQLRQLNRS